ncbi:uncharacterized protein LOC123519303 [Portunus trituberculatus]|uniref:uncharacterized protein LOC123519303 n=1 Tax=Portunus trituberculatus TaxID=210409 RepID=UPI001E1D0D7B|nr:uncharacterized protein LOC123519303 [Portunus trituberculatus]
MVVTYLMDMSPAVLLSLTALHPGSASLRATTWEVSRGEQQDNRKKMKEMDIIGGSYFIGNSQKKKKRNKYGAGDTAACLSASVPHHGLHLHLLLLMLLLHYEEGLQLRPLDATATAAAAVPVPLSCYDPDLLGGMLQGFGQDSRIYGTTQVKLTNQGRRVSQEEEEEEEEESEKDDTGMDVSGFSVTGVYHFLARPSHHEGTPGGTQGKVWKFPL